MTQKVKDINMFVSSGMEELFVSLSIARILKEKGFDKPCIRFFNTIGEYIEQKGDPYNWNESQFISIPIHQQVTDWFREKHNLHIEVSCGHDELCVWFNSYVYKLEKSYNYEPIIENVVGEEYYESINSGILEALKLI